MEEVHHETYNLLTNEERGLPVPVASSHDDDDVRTEFV
jgi:hypothetical protein